MDFIFSVKVQAYQCMQQELEAQKHQLEQKEKENAIREAHEQQLKIAKIK